MPVLNTKRETRKINLVTDPTAWVEIYNKQTYGDYLKIQKEMMGELDPSSFGGKDFQVKVDVSAFMIATLENMVVGWNFTDEAGNVLPITRENLLMLDTEDATAIYNEVNETTGGLPQDEESRNLEKAS